MQDTSTAKVQVGSIVRWGRSKPNQILEIKECPWGTGTKAIVRKVREDGTLYGPKCQVDVQDITVVL